MVNRMMNIMSSCHPEFRGSTIITEKYTERLCILCETFFPSALKINHQVHKAPQKRPADFNEKYLSALFETFFLSALKINRKVNRATQTRPLYLNKEYLSALRGILFPSALKN